MHLTPAVPGTQPLNGRLHRRRERFARGILVYSAYDRGQTHVVHTGVALVRALSGGQTAGYATAKDRVTIRITSGVSQITVR